MCSCPRLLERVKGSSALSSTLFTSPCDFFLFPLLKQDLKELKVVQLSHPPYSPDLSPCDFFLFPLLKKPLSGRHYESRSALGSVIYQWLQGIPKKAYFTAFTEWILRLEKCVSVKGEYFEGLKKTNCEWD